MVVSAINVHRSNTTFDAVANATFVTYMVVRAIVISPVALSSKSTLLVVFGMSTDALESMNALKVLDAGSMLAVLSIV